jgi:hypothetical protein
MSKNIAQTVAPSNRTSKAKAVQRHQKGQKGQKGRENKLFRGRFLPPLNLRVAAIDIKN